MRGSEIIGRPVVTLAGDDVAEIKDVLFGANAGDLLGFTLNGLGFLAGPLKLALPWDRVHAVGPDAVMIDPEVDFVPPRELVAAAAPSPDEHARADGEVRGASVVTAGGRSLGRLVDVVIAPDEHAVVGFEIEPDAGSAAGTSHRLVPIDNTVSVSGEALVVGDIEVENLPEDLVDFAVLVHPIEPYDDPDATSPPKQGDQSEQGSQGKQSSQGDQADTDGPAAVTEDST